MSGESLLERFRALDIDHMAVGLRQDTDDTPCFCTPVGARVVGSLGVDGVHFVQVPALDPEAVFSVTPIPCGEHHVEPVAEDFETFLRLVLACGGASPLEQVSYLDEAGFDQLLVEDRASVDSDRAAALSRIRQALGLEPHPAPYAYIKSLQKGFDYTTIPFSEEYYEVTGEPNPGGVIADDQARSAPLWENVMKLGIDISDET